MLAPRVAPEEGGLMDELDGWQPSPIWEQEIPDASVEWSRVVVSVLHDVLGWSLGEAIVEADADAERRKLRHLRMDPKDRVPSWLSQRVDSLDALKQSVFGLVAGRFGEIKVSRSKAKLAVLSVLREQGDSPIDSEFDRMAQYFVEGSVPHNQFLKDTHPPRYNPRVHRLRDELRELLWATIGGLIEEELRRAGSPVLKLLLEQEELARRALFLMRVGFDTGGEFVDLGYDVVSDRLGQSGIRAYAIGRYAYRKGDGRDWSALWDDVGYAIRLYAPVARSINWTAKDNSPRPIRTWGNFAEYVFNSVDKLAPFHGADAALPPDPRATEEDGR